MCIRTDLYVQRETEFEIIICSGIGASEPTTIAPIDSDGSGGSDDVSGGNFICWILCFLNIF